MRISHICFNPFSENTYLIVSESKCAVVDPGFSGQKEQDAFFKTLEENSLIPESILLTHAHFDHIAGVEILQKKFSCEVYMSAKDVPTIGSNGRMARSFGFSEKTPSFSFKAIREGDSICVGDNVFEVLETPGHTPGGVCYLCAQEGVLLSGDTIMAGCIGRTDLEGGDYDALMSSITQKILTLEGSIRILPGHGPSTTVLREGTGNPFLEPFNEPLQEVDETLEPLELHA